MARRHKVTLNVNRKAALALSKGAVAKLGLKLGDGITLKQDEDSPKDFYLCKDNNSPVKLRASSGDSLAFNNTAWANTILDAANKSAVAKLEKATFRICEHEAEEAPGHYLIFINSYAENQ